MYEDYIYNERQVEALTALLDNPSYNPFEVSHAIEAVANGFATAIIQRRGIILVPTEANINMHSSQRHIRTSQRRPDAGRQGAVSLAYSR